MRYNILKPCSAAAAASLLAVSCATTDPADVNKDGVLTVPELEAALVDAIIDYSDANADGSVTLAEWSAVNSEADDALFKQRDLNGDGKLDRAEAVKSSKRSKTWERLISKIDSDGDGTITESEKEGFRAQMDATGAEGDINQLREVAEQK